MKRALMAVALLALFGCSDPQDRPIYKEQLERMWELSELRSKGCQ